MTGSKKVNGEGTVYRRDNGKWRGQCYVTQTDGRRVRRTASGATRKEVELKMAQLLAREDQGRPVAPADLTVEHYLNEWLTEVVVHRVRPMSLKAYRLQVERHLIPGLGKKKLASLTARDVRKFFDGLIERQIGARTIGYVHSTLRAALEDALRDELVDRNVAKLVRVPRPEKVERKPLTVDEIKVLLRANQEHRLFAMLMVFALLGLRRSEVLGLMWEDIDLDNGWLKVNRGLQRIGAELVTAPTKTARSRRTIPLPQVVVDALREHRDRQAKERAALGSGWPALSFVFTTPIGTPIDPRNCTRAVVNACRSAGVRQVRLHDFRHGALSVLLALGVPPRTAMDIAGHSSLEMTMNVYGHVTLDDKREALDLVGRLFQDE